MMKNNNTATPQLFSSSVKAELVSHDSLQLQDLMKAPSGHLAD
jgi:hypothetical protein